MTDEASSQASDPLADVAEGASGPQPWRDAVRLPAFRDLLRVKVHVLLVDSLAVFLLVMLLADVAHDVMIAHVGPFRLSYLLILGLYGMCWVLGLVYAGVAARMFDPLAELARRGRTGT